MLGLQTKIIRSRMKELSKQGQVMAARRNYDLAKLVEDIEHQLVPKDTSDLDSTIRTVPAKFDPKRHDYKVVDGGVAKSGRTVNYGPDVNYGTVHSAPQPYVEPARELALKRSRNRIGKTNKYS
jgi:hypothetical protein